MRIEWIEVENFKGFDKRRFEFDEHFTLIVGENGAGKTSLLAAATELIALNLEALHLGDRFRQRRPDLVRRIAQEVGGVIVLEEKLPLRLNAVVSAGSTNCEINWVVDTALKLSSYPMKTVEALRAVFRPNDALNEVWPLFACFKSNRGFGETQAPDWAKIAQAQMSRNDGYLDWESPDLSVGALLEWMGKQEAISLQEQVPAPTYGAACLAMTLALPSAKRVWFSMKFGEPLVQWINGTHTGFSNLSDGQRSTLAIVGDIARRCALINPQLGSQATFKTPGVVLIDEIDLHLHPRWQRRIMEDLRRVFPKIQFIATTHSPIIISAAKDAKIISLDADGSHEISQAYGMDVNWVVDVVQGAEPQAHEVVELVRKIESLIEDARLEEARKLIPELERLQNGPSPDSVRLNAEMDTLIALANAED